MASPLNLKSHTATRRQTKGARQKTCWRGCIGVSDRQIGLLAMFLATFVAFHTLWILSSLPPFLQEPVEWNHYHQQASYATTIPKPKRNVSSIPATIDKTIPANLSYNGTATAKVHDPPTSDASHAIPKILIFTHYRDLLHNPEALTDDEEIVLSANIRRSIAVHHQEATVRFLTDEECIASLNKVFPSLIPYFQNETQGMFKADICRGSALYETGGMYLDADIGVRTNLWQDLLPITEFVTARVHRQSKFPKNFFQAILGAAPKSPIIFKYLQLFHDHYTRTEHIKKGPLGVILLRRAWERVYNETTGSPATELYQEVLYHPKLFPNLHPAPTWGIRRACHFIVVATAHSPKNAEMNLKSGNFHIPLYSRIGGSRMCPIHKNATTAKGKHASAHKGGE
jgi:hypothetical protein